VTIASLASETDAAGPQRAAAVTTPARRHLTLAAPPALNGDCADPDELLLERCRAGSEAAFDAIVQRYEKGLVRHCARMVGQGAAQDAAQDAFLSAWSAIREGAEIRALRPWLYTIAHRKAIAMLRDQRRGSLELPESLAGSDSPAEEAARAADVRQTLAALADLPAVQRDALVGIAVHGRSGRQVARQLGISECAARQLVFRARAALRGGAAACLVPPVFLLRLIRRIAASRGRVTLLARAGASGNGAESGARLLKLGAMAVAGPTAIGAGAYHLVTTPHGGAPAAAGHKGGAHRGASVGGGLAPDRGAPAVRAGAATASGRVVHAAVGTSTTPAVRASTLAGPKALPSGAAAAGATLPPTASSSADIPAAGSGAVAVGASVPAAEGPLGGSAKTASKVVGGTVSPATKTVAGVGQTVGAVATQTLGGAAGAVNGVTRTVGGAASTATQAAGQALQGVASTATGVAGAASGVVQSVGSAAAGGVSTLTAPTGSTGNTGALDAAGATVSSIGKALGG
jgi:RNA polymerase sigma-70 factor (ECF subfamily)